jgi:Ca2+/Na+ antiporter
MFAVYVISVILNYHFGFISVMLFLLSVGAVLYYINATPKQSSSNDQNLIESNDTASIDTAYQLEDEKDTACQDIKPCPYCHEYIKAAAVKCKHCKEWLDA